MELLLEVLVYLLVVLGLITVCITFFSKFSLIDNVVTQDINLDNETKTTYYRTKNKDEKLIINIKHKNITEEEMQNIKDAIEYGNYVNIADIADKVNYIDMCKKNSKK